MAGPGNGPYCPVDPAHGRMYSVDRSGDTRRGFRCMHELHGGNGRHFTSEEASGHYEPGERDMAVVYEGAARDVVAERITMDQAVQRVAKQTGRPTSQVREALTIMVDTIKEKDTTMADKTRAAKAKKTAAPKGQRRQKAKASAAEFQAVFDEYGLTNKQAAEATKAAGLGGSATYVYILTHTGASEDLLEKVKDAVRTYAKDKGLKRVRKAKALSTATAEPADPETEELIEAEAEIAAEPEAVEA